jgi:hypothetical protein
MGKVFLDASDMLSLLALHLLEDRERMPEQGSATKPPQPLRASS